MIYYYKFKNYAIIFIVKWRMNKVPKVKDLVLYQVATNRNYKVGDKCVFGEADNGQAYNIYNTVYQDENHQPWHVAGFNSLKKGIFKNKKLLIDLSLALDKYDFAFREIALEEVRREQFPHLPSRMKCMFLTDDKKECLENLPKFASKAYGSHYQAVAVKVSGFVFYARDFGVGRLGLSINQYKEQAVKYWSQDQNSTNKTKEILFIGEAEIVEILGEINT